MASVLPAWEGSSPPMPGAADRMWDSLEYAAEQLMVLKDFASALETCSSGLEGLALVEEEDARSELKAGFCILGLQALAEMNQWPAVLPWLLQHYDGPESFPARILQMCIVLYCKAGGAAAVQEAVAAWLHCETNEGAPAFRTVAELYLLSVLVPLGHLGQARDLVLGRVGSVAFSEEQRLAALEAVEEEESRRDRSPSPSSDAGAAPPSQAESRGRRTPLPSSDFHCSGSTLMRLLKLACKKLLPGSGVPLLPSLLLAALMLYMLLLRQDPALPSSFLWISKLLHLLRHLWNHVTLRLRPPLSNDRGL